MRFFALAIIGIGTFLGAMTIDAPDANAIVCARGVYRAGCAGPRGAAVVRRPVYAPRYGYRAYGVRRYGYRRW